MQAGIDVTQEYIDKAKPNDGEIIFQEGYNKGTHQEEISIGNWVFGTFGGSIIFLAETDGVYLGKSADYFWRNRLWELKSTGAPKSVDSVIRKAFKQIHDNPGGIILDYQGSKNDIKKVEKAIEERVRKSCRFSLDIIIVVNSELQKVIRFKK